MSAELRPERSSGAGQSCARRDEKGQGTRKVPVGGRSVLELSCEKSLVSEARKVGVPGCKKASTRNVTIGRSSGAQSCDLSARQALVNVGPGYNTTTRSQ